MALAVPAPVSVTPSSGTGLSQTFSFVFSDPNGASDLKQVNVDIDMTGANANSCLVSYMPGNKVLYLLNDAGNAYLPGIAIGTGGTLQNSQCSVNVGASSASTSGNNLTLNVAITFASTYTGMQSIYMGAVDNSNANSGWQILGSWTVGTSGGGGGGGTCNPGTAPSVNICSPTNGSTVTSPVHVLAVPASNNGVIAMAVYFDNVLQYKANVNKVDTMIAAAAGKHNIVVQFWDNSGNVPAKASSVVTVSGTSTSPTATMSASPTSITSGQSSTLTWSTTNATSVSIDNGIGTVAASGAVTVTPTTTTTYTLTATGSGGTATATATVTVSGTSPAPTATLTANPTSITSGQSSTLMWSTTNATSVSIDNGVGTVATSGSKSVSPAATTTYTLTATGPGGSTTSKATVTVGSSSACTPASGPPSVTICSPTNGSTVPSPVHVVAVPNSSNGVIAMAVYFDNTLQYKANVNKVDTMISAAAGAHFVVVQFWDNSGNVPAKASVNITVGNAPPAFTVSPLQATIFPNATQQFNATQNGNPAAVAWYVDGVLGGNNTVGTISTNGLYTAPGSAGSHQVKAVLNSDTSQTATAVVNVVAQTEDMTTYHNNLSRTGANLNEVILTPANVTPSHFGKLGSYAVDGQVYAQPLYLSNFGIGGGTHNVVFVATEHDSVYAFDADFKKSTPYWSESLLAPGQTTVGSGDGLGISPEVGITSTPVIDRSNNVMYVLTYVSAGGTEEFWLHALDLQSGAEKFGGPKRVTATVSGTGGDSSGGKITLEGACWQRAGLALANGNIYIGFGHCNHGWMLAYGATSLAQTGAFNTSPDGSGGTIWMSGGAPAVDSNGDVYVMAGTNFGDTTNTGFNNSFLKFSPSLSLLDYFQPSNNATLVQNDADLGSGAPMILPDNSSSTPHELVGAGKDGRIFLINRDNMGKFSSSANHVIQTVQSGSSQYNNFHDTPAYFNGNLYYHANGDVLRVFKWSNGLLSTGPTMTGSTVFGAHGDTPSISANGSSNAIVWELQLDGQPNNPAILHAYDATNVSKELYNSNMNAGDKAGPAVKFTVPTVINGKVYVPAGHEIDIYAVIH